MKITEQYADELNEKIFIECMDLREKGHLVAGTYCAFTPKEILAAAGVVPVSLCAGSYESAKKAELHLPRNMCDLIKSSYGHGISDTCPYFYFSDFIVADATCDGKKKMFEILSDYKETHVLDLPQSYKSEENYTYFKSELQSILAFVESKVGKEITVDDLNKAIVDYNRLKRTKLSIYELNQFDVPLVSGRELNFIMNGISFECHLDKRADELESISKEIEARKFDLDYIDSVKNKHRILLTGCPVTNTKLLDIIESKDAIVVAAESCGGLKTVNDMTAEGTSDPIGALAESYLSVACPCMTPNPKRFEIIRDIMKQYSIDAVVELTWVGCHAYNVEARTVKDFVVEEMGVSYLQIDTDYSEGDRGQIEVRVEALLEKL